MSDGGKILRGLQEALEHARGERVAKEHVVRVSMPVDNEWRVGALGATVTPPCDQWHIAAARMDEIERRILAIEVKLGRGNE